jgi:hypothetical protein
MLKFDCWTYKLATFKKPQPSIKILKILWNKSRVQRAESQILLKSAEELRHYHQIYVYQHEKNKFFDHKKLFPFYPQN